MDTAPIAQATSQPSLLGELLAARRLSLRNLAEMLGVGHTLIHAWVKREVPAERVAEVVRALELDADTERELYRRALSPEVVDRLAELASVGG